MNGSKSQRGFLKEIFLIESLGISQAKQRWKVFIFLCSRKGEEKEKSKKKIDENEKRNKKSTLYTDRSTITPTLSLLPPTLSRSVF